MTSLEEWRDGGRFVEWRGLRIFERTGGAGDAVVLVHGFPTASWDWWKQWPALTARYRVLTCDLVGFGFSGKPRDFPYSIAAQADLVEDMVHRAGVDRYHLVAHDYGVTVAQELLARAAPVHTVTLLNGGLFPETHRALLTQKLLASPLGPVVARLSSFRTFEASFRRICKRPLGDDELRSMWRLVRENDGLAVMPKLIGYMKERREHRARWVGALVGARVPVRLVNGLDDPVSGAHMVARYRELVARPDVVELRGVGHYPQLEAPAEVEAAVLEHLGRDRLQ